MLRPLLAVLALLAWYFGAPLQGRAATEVELGGLLLVAILIGWQVRVVLRSPYPLLRAVEALALSLPLLIVVFACSYFVMSRDRPGTFSEPLTRVDAMYFALTVFTTVGFGDITARAQEARIVVMVQMLADLIYIGLVVRVLAGAVRTGKAGSVDRGVPPRDA